MSLPLPKTRPHVMRKQLAKRILLCFPTYLVTHKLFVSFHDNFVRDKLTPISFQIYIVLKFLPVVRTEKQRGEKKEKRGMAEYCVTGGSGFIATYLIKALLQKGHTVRTTVRDPGKKKKKIKFSTSVNY